MQPERKQMLFNKSHVQRQFDRSAIHYDQVANMQRSIAGDLLLFAEQYLQPKNVLDAGCGTGYGLKTLMNAYPRAFFTGLDLSHSMLQVAQNNCTGVTFKQGDIEQLPFSDNAFDLTWSSSAIQWCDTGRAITELARVTQSDGCILLSTFTHGTLQDWRALWSLTASQRFDSVDKIESVFIDAGFRNIKLTTKVYTQAFKSFNGAVNSIRDLGAGNAEESRSRGLFGAKQYKEIKAKVDNIISDDGQLELPYFVTFVCAQRV